MRFHAFKLISRWARHENGATSIEYGLIAVGVALAIALIVFTLGENVRGLYTGLPALFN